MSHSTESRTSPRRGRAQHAPAAARPTPAGRPSQRLYRVVWRWHFYAGLFVAPLLIVMAGTGALYIFKSELEGIYYSHLLFVAPSESRASYDDQVSAALADLPEGAAVAQFVVTPDTARSTEMYVQSGVEYHRTFVDPYRGTLLGRLGAGEFFRVVLQIHRTLFAGTLGRVVVELATCWTIVLLISGAFLWWQRRPRGRTGSPRRVEFRVSRALVLGILVLAAVLRVLGLSIAAILPGEKTVALARSRAAPGGA